MKDLFKSGGKITEITIKDEMKQSFIDYAMSVIISRALPDVRDGLKPVHRRILYAMHDMGMYADKAYKKCARIVGEVLGKYHPHGDTAVYEALVRMAQSFSSRYTTIMGHGNFGSLDDGPAAMRYTEAKLSKISEDILADIESETVDFTDNFDGSLKEPKVLPSKIPLLLVNGSTGIAVGMATNIPPHNLTEIMQGLLALIDNPDLDLKSLCKIVKGPDFPSGASIIGTDGIVEAFSTGRGSVTQKASFTIEEIAKGKTSVQSAIIITALPYLVGAESFINKIAELVKNEKINGIADANDESGRDGTRIVIKIKKDANPQVVLNNLLKFTPLQQNFSVNMVALVNGKPRQLGLIEILKEFIEFRVEVLTRKAKFDLAKAEARLHIVEGLLIAIQDIDKVIKLIKASKTTEEARDGLMSKFKLSDKQANAILEMQLRRLTGLESEKLDKEKTELEKLIKSLIRLLGSRALMLAEIKKQSEEVIKKYGDERKTKIIQGDGSLMTMEDLVADEKMSIFITKQGYVKRIPLISFERQRRATKGKGGIKTREEDDLQHFFVSSMHDTLLFFTDKGQVYSTKVYDLPEGSRQAKGQSLVNFINIRANDLITAVIPVRQFDEGTYLSMLTRQGIIKKTSLAEFASVRKSGIIAINLENKDELSWVRISDGSKTFVLGTRDGMVIRYSEDDVRAMGRTAKGVKAITLREGDELVGFDVVENNEDVNLFVITNDGFGKRVKISEFRVQGRGGLGLIATKFKTAKSKLATIRSVAQKDEFVIATASGVVVRQKISEIPFQSRMATGVRVQKIDENDSVVSINPIINPDEEELDINEELLDEQLTLVGAPEFDEEPAEDLD